MRGFMAAAAPLAGIGSRPSFALRTIAQATPRATPAWMSKRSCELPATIVIRRDLAAMRWPRFGRQDELLAVTFSIH